MSRQSHAYRRLIAFEKALNMYQAWLRDNAADLNYLTLVPARFADAELAQVHGLLREQAGEETRPAQEQPAASES